ncbi:MAG: NAD(+)--rifampin ADP-ribosyltransferase [Acidobacteriota bacterium]
MDFDPTGSVVRLCLEAAAMHEEGRASEARGLSIRAWREATNDCERFLAADSVARHQAESAERLTWLRTALDLASRIDDDAVRPAFAALHSAIAECHEKLGDLQRAKRHGALALSLGQAPSDGGPFYHGTKADLQVGDLLTAGHISNYDSGLAMNHVYFTALVHGAGLAAGLADGDGRERVYVVEPSGSFEDDPNVTNKKFPGNPTRSYRTEAPLKIVGEVTDWARQSPEDLRKWRERLSSKKGEIIN